MIAPQPPIGQEVDCTDLDGFMLNVERLMASELVALSSHEVIGAALMLWCRAWKQRPAASLPNDDKVIAAFARMPLPRFRRLRDEVLRGFTLCSDGRLYHSTLAREAVNAYERKLAFQRKRETEAERLRKWRSGKHETPIETRFTSSAETPIETRFVPEGQGQGQGIETTSSPPLPASSPGLSKPLEPLGCGEQKKPPGEGQKAALVLVAGATSPIVQVKGESEVQAACRAVWRAYGEAYQTRYAVAPVRNAKVNALVKQLVQRLGAAEAPMVAAWFVSHSGAWYVKVGHSLDGLVKDAEKLRTEWATGRSVTAAEARLCDQKAANLGAIGDALRGLESESVKEAAV